MNTNNRYILGTQFGRQTNNGLVYLDPDGKETANPHILIAGTSGSGKSVLVKDMIKHMALQNKIILVFDLHGDLGVEGENHIEYTARNTTFGINPFEFDVDLKNGGPLVRVDMILAMFKKTFMPNMGTIQESVLRNLLIDTYRYKGIFDDKVETWPFADNEASSYDVGLSEEDAKNLRGGKAESKLPTMQDLHDVFDKVQTYATTEGKSSTISILEEAYKLKEKYENANSEGTKNKYKEKIQEVVTEVEEACTMFQEYISGKRDSLPPLKTEDNINYQKYESKAARRALETLGEYIKVFSSMDIFTQSKPRLRMGINRFDISGFTNADRPTFALFFVDLSIQRIFRKCKIKGDYQKRPESKKRGAKVDTYVVVDESRVVLPTGREKDNPFNIINRIASESRKYGLGLLFATQRITHYNNEILANFYTKIILKTDDSDTKETISRLGLQGSNMMEQINKKPGLAAYLRTGRLPESVMLNSWDFVVNKKEYLMDRGV